MKLHTEILGSGEPVVFLHTGLQTGTTDFEQQTEYFKQNYQVILPDLRGHGKSVSNDLSNYFLNAANDLAETLDSMGIDAAHIVGCSLGGLVSIFFAKNYPSKVKSMTLSGVIPEKPEEWEEMHATDMEHQSQLLQNTEAVDLFDSMHDGDWKQFLYMVRDLNWYPFDATGNLDTLDMPILLMVGEEKPYEVIGVTIYPKTNRRVHVSVIPFAGHLVHVEQPEIYSKTLDGFLDEVSKGKIEKD